MHVDWERLQDYANSMPNGHLKRWKANTMAGLFPVLVDEGYTREKTLDWVMSGLTMEGFSYGSCVKINEWLWNQ